MKNELSLSLVALSLNRVQGEKKNMFLFVFNPPKEKGKQYNSENWKIKEIKARKLDEKC